MSSLNGRLRRGTRTVLAGLCDCPGRDGTGGGGVAVGRLFSSRLLVVDRRARLVRGRRLLMPRPFGEASPVLLALNPELGGLSSMLGGLSELNDPVVDGAFLAIRGRPTL